MGVQLPAHIVRIKISIMVMINIISRSINLANGSELFIAGVETPIFKAAEHFLEKKIKKNGWLCRLVEADSELKFSAFSCW